MSHNIQIGMLGPLDVVVDGRRVTITGPRRRAVLATLALFPGRPVNARTLADYVWDDPPADIRPGLQTIVTRLRQALGVDVIAGSPGAYTLTVDKDCVDVHRFRSMIAASRNLPASEQLPLLEKALALWRGQPLSDVGSDRLAADYAPRLTEDWYAATERRIDLMLDLGRAAELISELRDLTARHSLREALWSRLMIALYRCGRQAEALEAYESVRRLLADQLGVDPGPELRATHKAVLTNDPALGAPERRATSPSSAAAPTESAPSSQARPAPTRVVPRQLPSDIGVFTGRTAQLRALDRLLESWEAAANGDDPSARASPIVIAAIGGAGGVGKTTLAVRWAHRVADKFPDGQLYINLRGYGPAEPIEPSVALEHLLRSLGVASEHLPPDVEGRSALLRTTMAGRRMLLLLDNARDAEQVRPLLPGGQCLVVITSRSQLRTLSAREGARRISLDQLPATESVALLRKILGPDLADRQPKAVAELAELCGHLPLAVAIAGERATRYSGTDLSALVDELRTERHRLDAFDTGDDHSSDLRAVLSWSYAALKPDAARMFRMLGLFPGDDITAEAAAALAGIPTTRARRLLDGLVNACQVQERRPGRYELHDLLRAYAAERVERDEPETERAAATDRIVMWYLHTAHAARGMLDPAAIYRDIPACPESITPLRFQGEADALAWFDAERANLIAMVKYAFAQGRHELVGPLSRTMWVYFDIRHAYRDWRDVYSLALESAQTLNDDFGQASVLIGLGAAYFELGETDRALGALLRARDLLTKLGRALGLTSVLANLSKATRLLHRYDEAIAYATEGLDILRSADNLTDTQRLRAEGNLLDQLAWAYLGSEQYQRAVEVGRQAVETTRAINYRRVEASCLQGLGLAYHHLGQYADAAEHLRNAAQVYAEQGNRLSQIACLTHLGHTLRADGCLEQAAAVWGEARAIAEDLDDPRAAELSELVATVGG